MKGMWEGPWVTGEILIQLDVWRKEGDALATNIMADLSRRIEDLELHDPILIGGKYTWVRGLNHLNSAWLDRFLHSTEWEESFKNIRQRIMSRVISNTTPAFWSVETGKKGLLILNLKIRLRSRVLMSWSRNGGMASQLKDAQIISYVPNWNC